MNLLLGVKSETSKTYSCVSFIKTVSGWDQKKGNESREFCAFWVVSPFCNTFKQPSVQNYYVTSQICNALSSRKNNRSLFSICYRFVWPTKEGFQPRGNIKLRGNFSRSRK